MYGTKFTVVTDNNPLAYVLTKAKLDATRHKWLSSLACYDFDIRYSPVRTNTAADILSRHPSNPDIEHMSNDSVRAVCNCLVSPPSYVGCMSINVVDMTEIPGEPMTQVDMRELRTDKCTGFWVRAVKDKRLPDKSNLQSKSDLAMYKIFNSLKMVRGLLYRDVMSDSETKRQLVLPYCFIELVLTAFHNDMGHPSKDRTLSLLRDRCFRPG